MLTCTSWWALASAATFAKKISLTCNNLASLTTSRNNELHGPAKPLCDPASANNAKHRKDLITRYLLQGGIDSHVACGLMSSCASCGPSLADISARETRNQSFDASWDSISRQLSDISEHRGLFHQALHHTLLDDHLHGPVNLAESCRLVPGSHAQVQAQAAAEQVQRDEALDTWCHLDMKMLLCMLSVVSHEEHLYTQNQV